MKVLIIIPAYNEEDSLPSVLDNLSRLDLALDVLVVDDGSSDNTRNAAMQHNAKVISLPFNLGIGGAVQTGYIYAREHGYDAAVQVDADGQHSPQDIPNLLEELQKCEADIVGGSRFLPGSGSYACSLPRRMGIFYFSWLLSLVLRHRVTDPTSGFRAANKKAISLFAQDYPSDYPEVDSLVMLCRSGLSSMEVPVKMESRQGGRSSISFFGAFYYMIKVTLSIGIQLLRSSEPR